jgi:hypothetical protein
VAAAGAGCDAWACSAFGRAGSGFMMLTGGIEADDGKSHFGSTGLPKAGAD